MLEVKEHSDRPRVRVYALRLLPDEGGFFSEALRSDWKELLGLLGKFFQDFPS